MGPVLIPSGSEMPAQKKRIGVIDDAMIERVGRALCDLENERHYEAQATGLSAMGLVIVKYEDWREDYNEQARVALEAALHE